MAKRRKKHQRPQTPPLSWVDKAIYFVLVLLLLAGMILSIALMDALRAKIAYREPTVLAFRGRLAYLWLFPFFAHLVLGCAIPLTVAHEAGQPIFGNKRIAYGERPWQKDLFPLLGPLHRKIERLTVKAAYVHTGRGAPYYTYGIVIYTADGNSYEFSNRQFDLRHHSHTDCLQQMLAIKALFSDDQITIEGTDYLPNVIDYYGLNAEDAELLQKLFG